MNLWPTSLDTIGVLLSAAVMGVDLAGASGADVFCVDVEIGRGADIFCVDVEVGRGTCALGKGREPSTPCVGMGGDRGVNDGIMGVVGETIMKFLKENGERGRNSAE